MLYNNHIILYDRLPLSLSLIFHDPLVPAFALTANPDLQGKRGMEVLDIVIERLAQLEIMVVLNIHMNTGNVLEPTQLSLLI